MSNINQLSDDEKSKDQDISGSRMANTPGSVPKGEPIMVRCEGSGCPGHLWGATNNTAMMMGTCSMCGQGVMCNGQGIAEQHLRDDILARIDRGDFK